MPLDEGVSRETETPLPGTPGRSEPEQEQPVSEPSPERGVEDREGGGGAPPAVCGGLRPEG
eukprot:5472364-Pyramimonas_sp.AAC.1